MKVLLIALLALEIFLFSEGISTGTPCSGAPTFSDPNVMLTKAIRAWPASFTIRLKCKANGVRPLKYTWLKDGQKMPPRRMDPHLNTSLWYLKLKDLRPDDSGKYTCIVSNRCGSINHTYIIEVVAPTQDPKRISIPAPPRFTVREKKLAKDLVALPVGNTLKLDCSAQGYPRPTVRWYKDAALLQERKRGSKLRLSRWTTVLVLKDVVPSDSGRYTCNVSNAHGWINHSYYVDVHERIRTKPVVLEIKNVTVYEGENVTLLCKVFSDSMPHFRWLRWFPTNSSGHNGTGSFSYEVLKHSIRSIHKDLVSPTDNKVDPLAASMTIVNVTKKSEGKYTCIVGNAIGYAVESAYIIVHEKTGQQDRNVAQNDGIATTKSDDTLEPKVKGAKSEKPGMKRDWTSRIQYRGTLIGVSVAVLGALILTSAWFCWKIKKTLASMGRRRPDIDSLYPKYEVKNEYVVVPDFN